MKPEVAQETLCAIPVVKLITLENFKDFSSFNFNQAFDHDDGLYYSTDVNDFACHHGYRFSLSQTASFLLQNESVFVVDIESAKTAVDEDNMSPMDIAVMHGDADMIEVFQSYGVSRRAEMQT